MRVGICLFGGLLLLAASQASAATINVPADWDTITSAVAAAGPGDTVLITNSGIYQEDLRISKKVAIVAAPGQSPTVKYNGGSPPVYFQAGSNGAQLGSISGGKISFDGNALCSRFVFFANTSPGEAVGLEHLAFCNPNPGTTSFYGFWWVAPGTGDVVAREVTMDCSAYAGSAAIRCDQASGNVLIERSRFKAASYGILNTAAGGATMTFNSCEIEVTGANLAGYLREGAAGQTRHWVFNNCWLRAANNIGIRWHGKAGHTLTMNGSVVSASARGVTLYPASCDGSTVNLDHCDFFSTAAEGFEIGSGNSRVVTIKNTNIYGATNGAIYDVANSSGDTVSMSYCNDYGVAQYTGFTPTNSVQPGQDPAYLAAAAGDYTLGNVFLRTAGEGGSPIGSHRSYANIVPVEMSTFTVN